MNTDELQCILARALRDSGMHFLGVYAADLVPRTSGRGRGCCCCIANTDPHNRPGEHWVALVFENGQVREYFDPYGMPLETYPALHNRLRNIVLSRQSTWSVQPPLSSMCGHFCIYYLCNRGSLSLTSIVNRLLLVPVRARDTFVFNYVRKLTSSLGIRRPCRDDACKGSQCCVPVRMSTQ